MLIHPQELIQQGYITGIHDQEAQVQPNALDFTIDKLFRLNDNNMFIISHAGKMMRQNDEVVSTPDRRTGIQFWNLAPLTSYDALSDIHVTLPTDIAAFLIIRSTFNRNGMFITAGLYDTGFSGHIGFMLHNRSGPAKIEPGTRIGQIVFVHSSSIGQYQGQWNHQQGTTANHHIQTNDEEE